MIGREEESLFVMIQKQKGAKRGGNLILENVQIWGTNWFR